MGILLDLYDVYSRESVRKKATAGNKEVFLKELRKDPFGVHLVIGKTGGGKTALCVRMAEFLGRIDNFAINMLKTPNWITSLKKLEIEEDEDGNFIGCFFILNSGVKIPAVKKCTLIVDDASNIFESNKMYNNPNETIKKLTFIARHLDIALFVNTQDSSSLNKQVVGQTKTLFLKEPSLFQFGTDRSYLSDLIEEARVYFNQVPKAKRIHYTYVFSQDYKGFIQTGLAKGWTKEISTNKGLA